MRLTHNVARITGTGIGLPERRVSNAELASCVSTNEQWIEETLGIRERRRVSRGELTSDLAAAAGLSALDDADSGPQDVDLVIVATSTPDRVNPSTACIVHKMLGMHRAAAFDVQAVCSGFLYAFHIAQHLIMAGAHRRILVIGADSFSSITDWSRRDCVFFGDGAGAAVLEAGTEPGLFVSEVHADGSGCDAFTVYPEDSYFSMNGRAVYDVATTVLPETIMSVLAEADLTIDDISLMIPHQPSIGILRKTAELIGLPFNRVFTNMGRYANTAGGTIPIAMHEARKSGRISRGDHLLFAAVGSGWTWGSIVFRWL